LERERVFVDGTGRVIERHCAVLQNLREGRGPTHGYYIKGASEKEARCKIIVASIMPRPLPIIKMLRRIVAGAA